MLKLAIANNMTGIALDARARFGFSFFGYFTT